MSVIDEPSSVCASTGLRIVPSRGQTVYRVARESRGALNPPVRGGGPPPEWSRWDTPGRTVYGGSTAKCAFLEVLAYVTPALPATDLEDLFDDVDNSDAPTLAEQVRRELPACGGMLERSLPQGWRDERRLYELTLPTDGWFVDITADESVAVINRECQHLTGGRKLTTSSLSASSDAAKRLTTSIATWAREQVNLFDGSQPHGIMYPSKWGRHLMNWAIWLRRTDDGVGPDPISLRSVAEIGRHTLGLVAAADFHDLRIY